MQVSSRIDNGVSKKIKIFPVTQTYRNVHLKQKQKICKLVLYSVEIAEDDVLRVSLDLR